MRKLIRGTGICLLLAALAWCGSVIADRQSLGENLIRLHVVANSDSREDQQAKLLVRDAVTGYLQENMHSAMTAQQAKQWLGEHLTEVKNVAQNALRDTDAARQVGVELKQEAFASRSYDTFKLPAGVYESLRITVGDGAGQNWWCVVFPSLCLPATSEGFADTAAGAGFPDSLTGALNREDGYEVRFFFLDCLGYLENLFFKG